MMQNMYIQIGTHYLFVSSSDDVVIEWVRQQFLVVHIDRWDECLPDIYIRVEKGYGKPVEDIQVKVRKEREHVQYDRDDFLLETDEHYRRALLKVHDDLSLNHALMTLYSAFIVHYRWGLMLHSSCVANQGRAYLFAGQSGAGKSTIAMLSEPRKILSDEATLLQITEDGVLVYDSPFRSDSIPNFDREVLPLAGIHYLEQSEFIRRQQIAPSEAVLQMMDKVFYWVVEPSETVKLLSLCGKLATLVPVYELQFQKNDQFWERIS
jgi:hypothetical protein